MGAEDAAVASSHRCVRFPVRTITSVNTRATKSNPLNKIKPTKRKKNDSDCFQLASSFLWVWQHWFMLSCDPFWGFCNLRFVFLTWASTRRRQFLCLKLWRFFWHTSGAGDPPCFLWKIHGLWLSAASLALTLWLRSLHVYVQLDFKKLELLHATFGIFLSPLVSLSRRPFLEKYLTLSFFRLQYIEASDCDRGTERGGASSVCAWEGKAVFVKCLIIALLEVQKDASML